LDVIPALSDEIFNVVVFGIVASAVIVNRVKKLILDPIAMHDGRAGAIAIGYSIGSPITIIGIFLMISITQFHNIEIFYFLGYVISAIVTLWLIKLGRFKS
ncbi:MAG: hypothetical protein AAF478_14290, partial [Pseudomonadota bacterium]